MPKPRRLARSRTSRPSNPVIFNAKVAKSHATEQDPWAQDWLKANTPAAGPHRRDLPARGAVSLRRNDA